MQIVPGVIVERLANLINASRFETLKQKNNYMKIYIIFLFTFFTACTPPSTTKDPTVETISVDLDKAATLDLSNSFDKITYTLLNDSNSFLIGDIDRMKIADNKIYLITSKRLLGFDINNGNPILNLYHLGKGPGEYLSLYDMWIDTKQREIELLDMNGRKIQRYNEQGILVKEIRIPSSSFAFCKINKEEYLLYNNNLESDAIDCQLIYYNTAKRAIKGKYFPINKKLANYFFILEANNFNFNQNGHSFFSCSSDTIYNITEDWQAIPRYAINFGKNHPPKTFLEEEYADIADFANQAQKNDYIYFINNISENPTHIIFSYKRGKENYWAIYNKSKAQLTTGKEILNSIQFPHTSMRIEYYNTSFVMDNDNFYFLIQPFQFIELLNKHKRKVGEKEFNIFLSKHKDIHAIYYNESFGEQSNPILAICKLRRDE